MNPIKKALSEVSFQIPRQLLEAVFRPAASAWSANRSVGIDSQIMNLVIKPRVLVDCDLIGGTEAIVSLDGLVPIRHVDNSVVINIPKDRTDGRSIRSVIAVLIGPNYPVIPSISGVGASAYSRFSDPRSNNALTNSMAGLVGSLDTVPVSSTAEVMLIGENVIHIRDRLQIVAYSALKCVLAHDENLSGIQLASYHAFSQLVVHAVKAYIYNELVIRIDEDQLLYGASVGTFKEIALSYSESDQNYRDYLNETWGKVSFMNDHPRMERHIRRLFGGRK
jgi:hypothetical protein